MLVQILAGVSSMNLRNVVNGQLQLQELLFYYNANISYIELPNRINGFIYSYNNIYNIFIEKRLSINMKKRTILHELAHIELHHLNQVDDDMLEFKRKHYEDDADIYINKLLKEKGEFY